MRSVHTVEVYSRKVTFVLAEARPKTEEGSRVQKLTRKRLVYYFKGSLLLQPPPPPWLLRALQRQRLRLLPTEISPMMDRKATRSLPRIICSNHVTYTCTLGGTLHHKTFVTLTNLVCLFGFSFFAFLTSFWIILLLGN